ILSVDVTADRRAAQTKPLDRIVKLFSRQIRMLQRDGRKRDEAIRMRGHPCREPLVLDLDDAAREIAIGGVPPVAVDAERLHVEPLLVHELQARGTQDVVPSAASATSARVARE